MKVQEFMSAPVVSIHGDTTLREIIQIINARQISHVPVIDGSGRLIGMIGCDELFPKARQVKSPDVHIPILFKQIVDCNQIVRSYKLVAQLTAKEIMSPALDHVDINDNIDHVIWKMAEKKLDALPVVSEGRLVGLLTRSDVIRLLAQEL